MLEHQPALLRLMRHLVLISVSTRAAVEEKQAEAGKALPSPCAAIICYTHASHHAASESLHPGQKRLG